MKINNTGSNWTEIYTNEETLVLFSYKTPVACHVTGKGFFKTDKKWSVTTSKHMSQFLSRHGAGKCETKPQEWFDKLGD